MAERRPPLFETGTYGCPVCGSPDIEFRDMRTHERTLYLAGMCHGLGEATAIHRWTIEFKPERWGMNVAVVPTHEDVSYPGRPPGHATFEEYKRMASKPLEQQLRESLVVLGIDPDAPKTEVEKALARKFDTLVLGKKPETQP